MRSNSIFCMLSGLALSLLFTGCGGGSVAKHEPDSEKVSVSTTNIAVVDINEVARQIGATKKIELSIAEFKLGLTSDLARLQDQLDEQLAAKRDKLNNDMNNQAQTELDTVLAQNQSSISQQTELANNQLAAHHNKLKLALLNQIRPVAFEVAAEKGMSIVLTTSQIYAAGPTSDITATVIERIQKLNAATETKEDSPPTRVAELSGGGVFKPY